jgi:hypothetical protein
MFYCTKIIKNLMREGERERAPCRGLLLTHRCTQRGEGVRGERGHKSVPSFQIYFLNLFIKMQ